MGYFVEQDLINALGANVVKAIFDDNADGVTESAAIAACIASASAEVDAYLAAEYTGTLPFSSPPDVVKYAAIDFGCAFAVRRRPDIMKALKSDGWKIYEDSAVAKMKRFLASVERLPSSTGTPSNVGGTTVDFGPRLVSPASDGSDNQGDW